MRGVWLAATLGSVGVGCTVEASQQLGDECLMTRECVAPLRCELTAEGVSRCAAPVRFDAGGLVLDTGPPDTGPPDAGPPDAGPPETDAQP